MFWYVHYRDGRGAGLHIVHGRDRAIDFACGLLAAGRAVLRIDNPRRAESISASEIQDMQASRGRAAGD